MPDHSLTVEPADPGSFAPFGQIVERGPAPPVFENAGLRSWRFDYQAIGTTQMMLCEFREIPLRFSRIERHHDVTQGFLPLSGRWMVMVVAADTGPDLPRPEALRAFLFAPHQGILLGRAVWHAVNRFPIGGNAVCAVLTTRETQAELEQARSGGPPPRRTEFHDFATEGRELGRESGREFRLVLPPGLMPA
jgi:ureidoglycolate hydrolase